MGCLKGQNRLLNPYETWYSFDNGQNNTFTTETQFNQVAWDLVLNVKDGAGNLNSSQVIVRKDAYTPQITSHSPVSDESFGSTAPQYNISIIEDDLNSTWYIIGQETFYIDTMDGIINQNKWDTLEEGRITITFYAQDNAGNVGSTIVVVNKRIPPNAIGGFDLIIIFGLISLTSIFLLIVSRRTKKA